jgi:hypothetical protein
MSWVVEKCKYERIAQAIDPAVRLVTKDGWYWKVIAVLLTIVTFGKMNYKRFLNDYATTIGPLQGYPRHWPALSARLLVHEARHTQQARWFGLWIHPWVGLPLYGILYLLLFFPLGLAFFRWRFEIDADKASYRWMLENDCSAAHIRIRAQQFGEKVCSGHYGWAWPRGASAFVKAANSVIDEGKRKQDDG